MPRKDDHADDRKRMDDDNKDKPKTRRTRRRKTPAAPQPPPPPPDDDMTAEEEDDAADMFYEMLQNALASTIVTVEPYQEQRSKKRKPKNTENNPAREYYDGEHARFYDSLNKEKKARIAEMERELVKTEGSSAGKIPKRFMLLESGVSHSVKKTVMAKVENLFRNDAHPAEKAKMSKWLDAFLRIPFGIAKPLPVNNASNTSDIKSFVEATMTKLDNNIHGHQKAKDQIIRTLAKWISNPDSRGNVIGLQGPMGCGKTTLVKKCIAEALGLPMVMIPLGGVTDSSLLTGHLYTYEGSTYGAVASSLMRAKCMNPVVLLDELDKVGGETQKGQEVYNTLIHLTDPVQNDHFVDNYFADAPLDLSKCLMVFTFNHEENINPILRDRMTIIRASGYNTDDKIKIAVDHLLPRSCKQHGIGGVSIGAEAVRLIIERIDDEQGVRNLERAIDTIVSNVNLTRMMEGTSSEVVVDCDTVEKYIPPKKADTFSAQHIYL